MWGEGPPRSLSAYLGDEVGEWGCLETLRELAAAAYKMSPTNKRDALQRAGLVTVSHEGLVTITDAGRRVVADNATLTWEAWMETQRER